MSNEKTQKTITLEKASINELFVTNQNPLCICPSTNRTMESFSLSDYKCPHCGQLLYEAVLPSGFSFSFPRFPVTTITIYRVYTCNKCYIHFYPENNELGNNVVYEEARTIHPYSMGLAGFQDFCNTQREKNRYLKFLS